MRASRTASSRSGSSSPLCSPFDAPAGHQSPCHPSRQSQSTRASRHRPASAWSRSLRLAEWAVQVVRNPRAPSARRGDKEPQPRDKGPVPAGRGRRLCGDLSSTPPRRPRSCVAAAAAAPTSSSPAQPSSVSLTNPSTQLLLHRLPPAPTLPLLRRPLPRHRRLRLVRPEPLYPDPVRLPRHQGAERQQGGGARHAQGPTQD